MAVPRAYQEPIRKYAPKIDRQARKAYGISGAALLAKLLKGESGFRMNAVSSANARGAAQFIPSTRNAVRQKFGIDPWRSEDEAVHAAVLHLSGELGNRPLLEGYNPGGGQQYVRYILGQRVGDLGAARGGGRRSTGRTGRTEGEQVVVGPVQDPQVPSVGGGGVSDLLAELRQRRQPTPAASIPEPAFSARSALKMPAFAPQIPSGGGGVSEPPSITDALTAIRGLGGPRLPEEPPAPDVVEVGGGGSRGSGSRGGRVTRGGTYPATRRGKLIGTPHAGTHTLGNWQSDNAVDLGLPRGTPLRAVGSGVVEKVNVKPDQGGRFAGSSVTIRTKNNAYFYAHLADVNVKPGQRVRRGQIIGRSGSANGVEHLHLGRQRGDPRNLLR